MNVAKKLINAPIKIAGEIWITCKHKDQVSKHGKVVRINTSSDATNPAVTATEGFTVNLLTHNAIQIGSDDSKYSCIFLAPRSIYSDVHKKSVMKILANVLAVLNRQTRWQSSE